MALPSLQGREVHVLAVWQVHHGHHGWLLLTRHHVLALLVAHTQLLGLGWLEAQLLLPPGWICSRLLVDPSQALAHSLGQGLDKIWTIYVQIGSSGMVLFVLCTAQAGVVLSPAQALFLPAVAF